MNIRIIYEDNHLLVVEKPVNILSQEDETGDPDMLTTLKAYIKERYGKPGRVWLGLVHRLDRPVGGCMAFAKTSKAASRLSEQVRTRSFKKTYLAVISGQPAAAEGRLEDFLLKDAETNTVRVVKGETPRARLALLDYRVLETAGGLSLVEVRPETGRPHQIRVQLSHMGHPLYGDRKYGGKDLRGQQPALWSYAIALEHPTKHEELTFRCPPPPAAPWNLFSSAAGIK